MLRTFYEIGKYICEQEGKDPLTLSLREQFESFSITREIAIKLKEQNETVKYLECELTSVLQSNKENYAALMSNSNGINYILFRAKYGKALKKSYEKDIEAKIFEFFSKKGQYSALIHQKYHLTDKVYNCLIENKKDIFSQLKKIILSDEDNYIITLTINGNYPYEISSFKEVLTEIYNNSNAFVSKKGICSVCGKEKNEFVNYFMLNENFSFFNFDKEIFSRNFDLNSSFINAGTCKECAGFINFGSYYINNNFHTTNTRIKSSGLLIVPRFLSNLNVIGNDFENFKIIRQLIQELKIDNKENKNKKSSKDSITSINKKYFDNREGFFVELISEFKDHIMLDIYVYESKQKKRELKKSIKEVLPSRMRLILNINQQVELIYQAYIKNDKKTFYPLSILWNVITKKDIQDYEKPKNYQYSDYINFLGSIFSDNEKVSMKLFIKSVNNYLFELIQKIDTIEYVDFKVLDIFYLNLFFENVKIYYDKEETRMDIKKLKEIFEKENAGTKFVDDYWSQFINYPEFFSSPEKCFAFLMGKLTVETRYERKGKGSFLDGWLSNFSTNIYKLPQLMERCIETLAIEDKLLVKQGNILAITSFFSKLVSQDNLAEKHEDLIFPFVTGFCFYNYKGSDDKNNMEGN